MTQCRPVAVYTVLSLLAFGLSACSGGSATDKSPALTTVVVAAEGSKTSLMLGETVQMTATGKDQDNADFPISSTVWSSSNQLVATVSSGGLVTP